MSFKNRHFKLGISKKKDEEKTEPRSVVDFVGRLAAAVSTGVGKTVISARVQPRFSPITFRA